MKPAKPCLVAFVTAPNKKTARRLAEAALRKRLAACVNLVPRLESLFWWKGEIDSGQEVLMIFKTVQSSLADLEKLVLELHPYDTPEFVAWPLSFGSEDYLTWLMASCNAPAETPSKARRGKGANRPAHSGRSGK